MVEHSEKRAVAGSIDQVAAHKVSRGDLPFHCPPDGAPLWSMHPRVYLPLEQAGRAVCPYCGAEYVLED